MQLDKIWENASPTSSFGSTSIFVPMEVYKYILIIWRRNKNSPVLHSSGLLPIVTPGGYYINDVEVPDGSNLRAIGNTRTLAFDYSYINIQDNYQVVDGVYIGVSNDYNVPYQILGLFA